jgi:hypothetical protein
VKFHDSIDLRSDLEWNNYRKDTITTKEKNTFVMMDSLMKNTPMESVVLFSARVATGFFPIGKFDLDVRRLGAFNKYEGIRLGLGLYTNKKISKYFSVGGWAGYGFRDKKWKYGYSATVFPKGDKESWFRFSYQEDYRTPGRAELHPDLSRTGFQNYLLQEVDIFKEYAISAGIKAGYWDLNPELSRQEIKPLDYRFEYAGKQLSMFESRQASIGFRFAFNEKRIPFFEYYLPVSNDKYPILYFRMGSGMVKAEDYKTGFVNALAAISYRKQTHRWGKDNFQLEAGITRTNGQEPLPKSFLFAGNGFRRSNQANYYTWGGFPTMKPFEFYSDRYISLLYKHDFEKYFWDLKWSKPFLSLAHNMIFGSLHSQTKLANGGLRSYGNGYHESGFLINRIVKMNIKISDLNFNTGVFYHWTADWNRRNAVWVVGVSTTF